MWIPQGHSGLLRASKPHPSLSAEVRPWVEVWSDRVGDCVPAIHLAVDLGVPGCECLLAGAEHLRA